MKRGKNIFLNIVIALLIAGIAVSAFVLIRYASASHRSKSTFDELAHLVESHPQSPSSPESPEESEADSQDTPAEDPEFQMVTDSRTGKEIPVLPEYAELYRQNPDVVGWIRLSDTVLNYPVMQTPDRKEYYLRRDFYGKHSTHGCLFVQEQCDVFRPSDNITIYGHNMHDGSMFAVLHKYENMDFWKTHPVITFDTLSHHNEYEIFSVFKTSATKKKGFNYQRFVDARNKSQFDRYVKICKDLSLYDTGISPQYGDKLITLSTCDYSLENGRLVVVARKAPDAG